MKPFLDDHFLLFSKSAKTLYHDFARDLPIIDFHSHLNPKDLAENRNFSNLTQAWLEGDHYKWRAMRTNGVHEKYITGNASDLEKFKKWAYTVPFTLRNPLYHWTHLELRRYFGIHELLHSGTANNIFEDTREMFQSTDYSCQNLLRMMHVEVVCTSDDPIDSLAYHQAFKDTVPDLQMRPSFRADKVMALQESASYNHYLDDLEKASDQEIGSFNALIQVLKKRHDYFSQQGCRLSDHGFYTFYADAYTHSEVEKLFSKIRSGAELSLADRSKLVSAILYELAVMHHDAGWTQQFHYGALRNVNTLMLQEIGPDSGYDSIGDPRAAIPMARLFDRLAKNNKLAKTIVYNLNPADNEVVATMMGNFQDGSVPAKMQFGSGWWFLDQKEGMEKQLNALSNMGLLSRFVGMLTDSRSFLSYPRHEYFRRILCNLLGSDMENGLIPADFEMMGNMVQGICYYNAKHYFGFEKEELNKMS